MAQSKQKKSKQQKPRRRIWRNLLIGVVGLVVFLLMFVSAFVFNPFEGSLPELRDVVPRDVNFFVRKRNLAEDFREFPEPHFWTGLSDAVGFEAVANGSIGQAYEADGLGRALREAKQAFEQVRVDSGGFLDVMRDVIGEEVIVAGYNQDYSSSPPRPLAEPRWCLYARVNWRVKALHGLAGFGFVQSRIAEQGIQVTSEDDLLVVTLPGQRAPLYVMRHLDALLVTNHKRLIEDANLLVVGSRDLDPIGQQPAYTDGAEARIAEWADTNSVDDPNVVEFVVEPNAFDGFRRFAQRWPDIRNKDSMNERVLASFLNLSGWMQLTGGLIFHDDVLALTGQIGLNSKQHTPFQASFYTAEQQRREQWLDPFLRLVPESACAAAALRMPAADFLLAMFEAQETDVKSLVNDALRRANYRGESLTDFRDLVSRLRGAFLRRTGFIFRKNTPDMSRDKETGELLIPVAAKSPMPQVAWVFWLRPGFQPVVEELVTMMRTYSTTFGFRQNWHLKVKFGDGYLKEPVTEFTNPQIPATGEMAALVFRDFFILSNSGPLIQDIVRTRYGARTGMKSLFDSPEFRPVEAELPAELSGLVWLNAENLEPVIEDYLKFAESSGELMDPDWAMQVRPTAEEQVRRQKFPTFASKAAMPETMTQRGGEFDVAVREYLQERWRRERTNFTAEDKAGLEQMRGICQLLRSAAIQLELQNNYIRYQARIASRLR